MPKHEIGHMLGLNHANENGKTYGDSTGYMAAGHKQTNWPQKCFNGQKNWKLGWYYSRQESIRMRTLERGALIKLATFVDFDISEEDEPVLLNVVDAYYLQYNVAKDFNSDTEEKKNKVTITAPTGGGSDGVEGLGVGDIYSKFFFEKSKRTLVIEACETRKGRRGADIMVISIAFDRSLCERKQPETNIESKPNESKLPSTTTKPSISSYVGMPLSMIFPAGYARLIRTEEPTTSPSVPPTAHPTENPSPTPTRIPTTSPTLEPTVSSVPPEQIEPSRLWKMINILQTMYETEEDDQEEKEVDPPKSNSPSIVDYIFRGTGETTETNPNLSTVTSGRSYSSGVVSIFNQGGG